MRPMTFAKLFAVSVIALFLAASVTAVVMTDQGNALPSGLNAHPNLALERSQQALATVDNKVAQVTSIYDTLKQAQGLPSLFQHVSTAQLAAYGKDIASMSPQLFASFVKQDDVPVPAGLSDAQFQTEMANVLTTDGLSLQFSWSNWDTALLFAVVSGCAIGAVIGAGVGCVVGAVVGAVLIGVDYLFATAGAYYTDILAWEAEMSSTLYNEEALISSDYQTVLTLLNSTVYALDTEADATVPISTQLNNASFNGPLALTQGFVYQQLVSIQNAFVTEASGVMAIFISWMGTSFANNAIFGFGQPGNPANDYAVFDDTLGCGGSNVFTCGNASIGMQITVLTAHPHQFVYIDEGSTFDIVTPSSATATLQAVTTLSMYKSTSTWLSGITISTAGIHEVNWTHEGGLFEFNLTSGASAELFGPSIMSVSPGSDVASTQAGYNVDICGTSNGVYQPTCNPLSLSVGQIGFTLGATIAFLDGADPSHNNTPFLSLTGQSNVWSYSLTELAQLFFAAQTNAQVYWSFLRGLGYTAPGGSNPVPPGCTVPYPSQAIPPAWSTELQNFTVQQTQNLYVSWLNGEAIFFDTAPGSGAGGWCHGYPQWILGNAPWGSLWVNASGFVYVPYPTGYPGEQFSNFTSPLLGNLANPTSGQLNTLATWAVNGSLSAPVFVGGFQQTNRTISCWTPIVANGGPQKKAITGANQSCAPGQIATAEHNATQLLLWPNSGIPYYNVTVGKVFNLPADVPATIYATESGAYFGHASGNGTVTGNIGGSTPGYAVYLTSCYVNGTAEKVCNLALSTISGYIANLTNCLTWGYVNKCEPPTPPSPGIGGGICGWPFISIFTNAFAGIGLFGFNLGDLGCVIGFIVLFAIIGVVVWLVDFFIKHRPRSTNMSG